MYKFGKYKLGGSKHGPCQYDIVRSDGVTQQAVLERGWQVQQYVPGIPEGTVFTLKRQGGSLTRYYVVLGGAYTKIKPEQYVTLWQQAVAKHEATAKVDAPAG